MSFLKKVEVTVLVVQATQEVSQHYLATHRDTLQPQFEALEAQGSRVEKQKDKRNFFENCIFSKVTAFSVQNVKKVF